MPAWRRSVRSATTRRYGSETGYIFPLIRSLSYPGNRLPVRTLKEHLGKQMVAIHPLAAQDLERLGDHRGITADITIRLPLHRVRLKIICYPATKITALLTGDNT